MRVAPRPAAWGSRGGARESRGGPGLCTVLRPCLLPAACSSPCPQPAPPWRPAPEAPLCVLPGVQGLVFVGPILAVWYGKLGSMVTAPGLQGEPAALAPPSLLQGIGARWRGVKLCSPCLQPNSTPLPFLSPGPFQPGCRVPQCVCTSVRVHALSGTSPTTPRARTVGAVNAGGGQPLPP